MKKYRCPNCKEVFVGTQEVCPKCGVKLRYADKEKEKKPVVEEATTVSNFVFSDPDVVKHEEKFVPVTTLDSPDGPVEGQDAVQALRMIHDLRCACDNTDAQKSHEILVRFADMCSENWSA